MEENNKYHITRIVATIGSDDPNDTRACRLHDHCLHGLFRYGIGIIGYLIEYDEKRER